MKVDDPIHAEMGKKCVGIKHKPGDQLEDKQEKPTGVNSLLTGVIFGDGRAGLPEEKDIF